jgi:hypothetical protein
VYLYFNHKIILKNETYNYNHSCIDTGALLNTRLRITSLVFVHQVIEDLRGSHGNLSLGRIHLVISTNIT